MDEFLKTYSAIWQEILPSYLEYTVPENTPMPYITFTAAMSPFSQESVQKVSVWTQGISVQETVQYVEAIGNVVPEGGAVFYLPDNQGAIQLFRGTPFIQHQPTEEDNIKNLYANVIVRCYIY